MRLSPKTSDTPPHPVRLLVNGDTIHFLRLELDHGIYVLALLEGADEIQRENCGILIAQQVRSPGDFRNFSRQMHNDSVRRHTHHF